MEETPLNPSPMSGYRLLGWGYVAACTVIALEFAPPSVPPAAPAARPTTVTPSSANDPDAWFRRVKPYCNSVEIAVLQRGDAPPSGARGAGFHAACFAIAGRTDDARRIIDKLDAGQRAYAAEIVFEVGHPVADAGDDRSAGPIMELVVDYVPNHYMALYHAGMAEYMLGQHDLARKNLQAFVELYRANDGWRSNGLEVLGRLRDSTKADDDRRRPREPGA